LPLGSHAKSDDDGREVVGCQESKDQDAGLATSESPRSDVGKRGSFETDADATALQRIKSCDLGVKTDLLLSRTDAVCGPFDVTTVDTSDRIRQSKTVASATAGSSRAVYLNVQGSL